VNQAYVLATSQKIDISKIAIDAKFNDSYFKHEETAKSKEFLEKTEV
jgi:large subunit ribosomal protein L6e